MKMVKKGLFKGIEIPEPDSGKPGDIYLRFDNKDDMEKYCKTADEEAEKLYTISEYLEYLEKRIEWLEDKLGTEGEYNPCDKCEHADKYTCHHCAYIKTAKALNRKMNNESLDISSLLESYKKGLEITNNLGYIDFTEKIQKK